MSYSFGEMKRLEKEAETWREKAEEYQKLTEKIGQKYPEVLTRLKNAVSILEKGGVWEGPDGEACRKVISELQQGIKKEQNLLQEMADEMSEAARRKAQEVSNKLINEVYPNMSFQGKIDAFADYLADRIVDAVKGR